MTPEDRTVLLQNTKTMMELERSLTATLEKVEPWLPQNSHRQLPNQPRVRPIPTSMEEVERILAVARAWATRTSAPVGWNPSAPVVGFRTPNPLPHQLRGGALAALQLERARQTERLRKRKAEAVEAPVEKTEQEEEEERDPKRKEINQPKKDLPVRPLQQSARAPSGAVPNQNQKMEVSMNLSDSSSDDEDD
ncbi:hypothetical protein FisN_1Lh698 [Fistulifera solaris]|uniref:Uncharacterized protein n=1 Tax=Fistulifera solaris TaxID=1519565 RepID=A0A1Z5KJJ2_FISSO|nr:hypothetical protein FisN_1Lh698 [Fistulifera solaris]|eukprot:GAX26474.1 hypothetical protein FisN_1Lh698 [Fistulifera solaris]